MEGPSRPRTLPRASPPSPALRPPEFERGRFKGGIEVGRRARMLGCVGGDALADRGPSPLPEPGLYCLAGDDRGGPLQRCSLLTQGRVDVLREGEVKVLYGGHHDGFLHATIVWHYSWQVKHYPCGGARRG